MGLAEAAELLGITRPALVMRRRRPHSRGDVLPPLPSPIAELQCGPIWRRAQLEAYVAEEQSRRRLAWAERYDLDRGAIALEFEKAVERLEQR